MEKSECDPVSAPPVNQPEQKERLTKKDWLEIGFGAAQTLIFLVMLWSIWQTKESLDISRKQFETTIEPVIQIDLRRGVSEGKGTTHFTFSNSGPVAVVDLGVRGILYALCTPSTNGMFATLTPKYVEGNPKFSLRGQFTGGMVTNIPTESVLQGDPIQVPGNGELEVIGVIVGYRRQVDMKYYCQLLTLLKSINPKTGESVVMGFYGVGGDAPPSMIDVAKLRLEVEDQFLKSGIAVPLDAARALQSPP